MTTLIHTDYTTSPPTVERLSVSTEESDWIMKVKKDGTPFETSEELEEGYRRYSRYLENREID